MLRGFKDSAGVDWRVWAVFPSTSAEPTSAEALSRSSLKETPFANGWLCFESKSEKRRLAPIPSGWEFGDVAALEKLCAEALLVPSRARRGNARSRVGAA